MKKVIAILLVLCVAVTLFAAGSVKVGGTFNFVTGKTVEDKDKDLIETNYKSNGFGFDLSGSFDVTKDIAVWADFNMVFCADAKIKYANDTEWTSMNDEIYDVFLKNEKGSYKKYNILSFSAGAAYKLTLDPVDVKLGGGLFIDRLLGKVGVKDGDTDNFLSYRMTNFGIALYADCNYKFNQNFGVGLTVMPHIGLYNSVNESIKGMNNYSSLFPAKLDVTARGFKLSFAMPIVVGVSYSF